MKLIQLPNGDWIRPDTVTAIIPRTDERIFDQGGGLVATISGAQCVDVHHVEIATIYAKGDQKAEELAGEIAGLVHGVTTADKRNDTLQIEITDERAEAYRETVKQATKPMEYALRDESERLEEAKASKERGS